MNSTNDMGGGPKTKSLFLPKATAETSLDVPGSSQTSSGPAVLPTRRIDFSKKPEVGDGATTATEQRIPGTPSELDQLTIEALQARREELEEKILAKRETEKRAVINQIVDLVNTHGIPVHELVDALGGLPIRRKLGPAVQKFQDPETGLTWSGRGKEPLWLRGKDRMLFLIA